MRKSRAWLAKQRGYDSEWESRLNQGILREAWFHNSQIPYHIEKVYHPDWTLVSGDRRVYIEAKGRFMDMQEAAKYKWVKKALKPTEELVFLFMRPELPLPNARPRKDGSKRTHYEWAEANGFRWFNEDNIVSFLKGLGYNS
tara:strand:- start:304 stop:729 length:426 start_codon:yes stop_codon:yes gene_type:complete